MSTEVNLTNVRNYIEGTTRAMQDSLGILPNHIKEQVVLRLIKCQEDCIPSGKCIKCQCKTPQRLYTTETCNPERHLDLMDKEVWEQYKIDNGII